jgi:hypothetical protein
LAAGVPALGFGAGFDRAFGGGRAEMVCGRSAAGDGSAAPSSALAGVLAAGGLSLTGTPRFSSNEFQRSGFPESDIKRVRMNW